VAQQLNAEELWKAALGELEVSFPAHYFKTWFRDTFIAQNDEHTIAIAVPSNFARDWLEKKCHRQISQVLRKLNPQIRDIRYTISTTHQAQPTMPSQAQPKAPTPRPASRSSQVLPRNTFDSFIVGKTSQLAYASSLAVAKKPGLLYNPFFIYGGVGLGKTHLLHAIGNYLLAQNPNAKIVYVSCETFTNEFVAAIQSGKMSAFKRQYREVDALLVDDIQFIANKEGTQEEFFHTFNSLQQTNRQIVITADRPPTAIPGLEARLSSRFGGGMIADVQPPDVETREAILKSKCAERKLEVPQEVISRIVSIVQSNVRELEGALTRVVAFSQMHEIDLTPELVVTALEGVIQNQKETVTVDKVLRSISDYFRISRGDLVGGRRTKELVYPRQLAMYLLRHELQLSFPRIGSALGGKDHTTIMHGCTKIEKDLARNPTLQEDLSSIKELLQPTRVS